jgi:flagellar basal body L-ring protein FlgH
MKLHQRTVAMAAAIVCLMAPAAFAQTPALPAAPRKLISPVRGEATVEYTRPNTTRKSGNIITVMVIKNTSALPIAGFRLEESWSDKTGNLAGGDVYRHPRPFMPGEVITVTLTTPTNPRMSSNSFNFVHANGTVKPRNVPKIDVPKTEG